MRYLILALAAATMSGCAMLKSYSCLDRMQPDGQGGYYLIKGDC